ncbi:hypothetical protein [Methylobacterium oryzisoli]|uniref:hypothetical protein n=1 Tax=Methylobacterium oryzisoli TaxID=3385502 RepID=UPI0038927730
MLPILQIRSNRPEPRMMRSLLCGILCALTTAAPALAREVRPAALVPLERAATDCFAETIGNNAAALAHARTGHWYEAAGVIGFLCRPEVDAMMRAHDARYGEGAGWRYFRGAYTRHLGRELEVRLAPLLQTKALATAEPRADAEPSAEPKP